MTVDKKSPESIRSEELDKEYKEEIIKKEEETDDEDDQSYSKMNKDLIKTRRDFIEKEKRDEKETSPLQVQKPKTEKESKESKESLVQLKEPSDSSLPPVIESDDLDDKPTPPPKTGPPSPPLPFPPVVSPAPKAAPTPIPIPTASFRPIHDKEFSLEGF